MQIKIPAVRRESFGRFFFRMEPDSPREDIYGLRSMLAVILDGRA